ncbi:hypothetical protein K0U91_09310 [Chryseobacterium chendengshani]|uniref:hypothetical protein n=1 Tax=Chryseobacterium sp. LJ668 TaxID=2864040 RepID=UPI001C68A245|nr:hypothetical protein [Chryseobacterium sp. LJ668]MBW8524485.1 hypothetical protein [Chryseobacterium sp. LJ668]QYK15273.1 hypothetical protein K0U91_09310 [Chryseobacterium sp. LJ668]
MLRTLIFINFYWELLPLSPLDFLCFGGGFAAAETKKELKDAIQSGLQTTRLIFVCQAESILSTAFVLAPIATTSFFLIGFEKCGGEKDTAESGIQLLKNSIS